MVKSRTGFYKQNPHFIYFYTAVFKYINSVNKRNSVNNKIYIYVYIFTTKGLKTIPSLDVGGNIAFKDEGKAEVLDAFFALCLY